MKNFTFALALVALFSMNLTAQDGCGSKAKKSCDGGACSEATLVKKQDEAKKGCSSEAKLASKPQEEKKNAGCNEVIKRGGCGGELTSGCSDLDAYLSAEAAAAKGCETSKAKLVKMDKANPKLAKMAGLYKNACNGCDKSAAKLAALRKEAQPQEEPKKADCNGGSCDATAKKAGSGCDKLDAYLAAEGKAAKGCEASKAKLATLTKDNPELPKVATLYKNACNGCEKSKAKLAAMQKDMEAKKAAQIKKSDCESACGESCADACEPGAAALVKAADAKEGGCCAEKAKMAKAKADCGSADKASCGSTDKAKLAKAGSGCDQLDAYLAAEGKAAKGCEASKAKLATLTKDNPELPKIAGLYKNACNGCEKSKAKLAEMKKAHESKKACDGKSSCDSADAALVKSTEIKKADCESACGDACADACEPGAAALVKAADAKGGCCAEKAKLAKAADAKSDCGSADKASCGSTDKAKLAKAGSGCDKLDAYLAAEGNAEKGCPMSKAKLATLTKENPELPKIATLYKNACNGCEKSKAKLAEMKKAAESKQGCDQKKDCDSKGCDSEGKLIEKKAEGGCCSEAKTVSSEKKVHKAECCPGVERKEEPKSALKEF